MTDVYGDRTARHGTVIEDGTPLQLDTESLLPLGELVLSGDVTSLEQTGRGKVLGRDAIEYPTCLSDADGLRGRLRRLLSGPYTLLREVTDEHRSGALLRVEVSSLDEGVVTDPDVRLTRR